MDAAREKGQADFDLDRFIDMFDEALTSKDERVVNALRSLMMMVVLTKPESREQAGDGDKGPLRQLFDDLHHMNRRMHSMEDEIRRLSNQHVKFDKYEWEELQKYKLMHTTATPQTWQTWEKDFVDQMRQNQLASYKKIVKK